MSNEGEAHKVQHLCFLVPGGRMLELDVASDTTLRDVGERLQAETGIAPNTLRLLLPHRNNIFKKSLFLPFSSDHGSALVDHLCLTQGRPIRVMGVSPQELEDLSQNMGDKYGRLIPGFEEEERRAKQRIGIGSMDTKRPSEGHYVFADFRTLQLPGIVLHPPAEEALEIMHKLANDRGIVAIMNKHRWRVGVMTEMAPLGYVGISPKCILGFNKNHGEEISLRLRTDDLKGFRKYESIKKTLLHELAHMIYSEHDANFYALNKQLNEEAIALDWTKTQGHKLAASHHFGFEKDATNDGDVSKTNMGHKVGGTKGYEAFGACSAAGLAALERFSRNMERQTDDTMVNEVIDMIAEDNIAENTTESVSYSQKEPDPDDGGALFEPLSLSADAVIAGSDDAENTGYLSSHKEPDPYVKKGQLLQPRSNNLDCHGPNGTIAGIILGCQENIEENQRPGALEVMPVDPGIQSLQEHTDIVCQRLNAAISTLKLEATPYEVAGTIQTLTNILRNLKEHPDEVKYKRFRKTNLAFHNQVGKFKGALDFLQAIGFSHCTCPDMGEMEYLVLAKIDPVLIWLAQSTLEAAVH